MTTNSYPYEVLNNFKQTRQYLDDVCNAADVHRDALGFFAKPVYEEFAQKNCLYVLVNTENKEPRYAGHLMFRQRYPSASIVQMFTDPQYRRKRLASHLLDHFKNELTSVGFTSIYARVAEDLYDANAFWTRQQFQIQSITKGGKSRDRQILKRCHELKAPQLFPSSGINNQNPLGLCLPETNGIPFYLLDLNVLFDLTGPRRARHNRAIGLFQIERMRLCKFAISKEIREELNRSATPGKLDPMEGIIDILPTMPTERFDSNHSLFNSLVSIVFPHKEALTKNDKSDLCHIATVIQNKLTGLITSDTALLKAAPKIKEKYGSDVISPEIFMLDDYIPPDSVFQSENNTELTLKAITDELQRNQIFDFLRNCNIPILDIASDWLPTGLNSQAVSCFGVWINKTPIGYITWPKVTQSVTIVVHAVVDNSNTFAADAARIMFIYLLEQIPRQGPKIIKLEKPQIQPIVSDTAIKFGFRGQANSAELYKISLGSVLTRQSWTTYQKLLQDNCKIKLPDCIPAYQHAGQQIDILGPDGNRRFIALDELESLLAPTLLCLLCRPAVLTPIQGHYAELLLEHSCQLSLLPSASASLFHERHYICGPRNFQHFTRGVLILFYESSKKGGQSAVIAIARVRQAYLKKYEEMSNKDLKQSIFKKTNIGLLGKSEMKTVVVFDNTFILPRSIPLETLRRLGCGSSTRLMSTKPITDSQLQGILTEAFCYAG